MKCLIYERDVTGHRLHHVRHLTDALLEVGCHVIVALPSDAQASDEYRVHLSPLGSEFELLAQLSPDRICNYRSMANRVGELLNVISDSGSDWAYIPYADMMTQAAAVRGTLRGVGQFRRIPIEGQVMRGRYAYPSNSLGEQIGASASRWLVQHSPWKVTHLLDTWVYNNLQGTAKTTEFRLIPEPVEPLPQIDRYEARRTLGIPTDGRYVVAVGGMEPRKGIDLLLAAFARANLRSDDRLLLIGKFTHSMNELVAREHHALVSAGRLVLMDRYVTDDELGCGLLAGDVLVTPHPRQVGSSGTLVRAVAARRPMIASDFGWVGWVTKKFDLGVAVDVGDIPAFAAAIEAALDRPPEPRGGAAAERFRRYHTLQNQKAHWLVSLGRESGIPLGDFANRVDWDWVLKAAE